MKRKVGRPRKNPIDPAAPAQAQTPAKVGHFCVSVSDSDGCHLDADSVEVRDDRLVLKREGHVVGLFAKWEYAFEISKEALQEIPEELPGESVVPVTAAAAITQ